MHCSDCGAEVRRDAKHCPKCGEKFDEITGHQIGGWVVISIVLLLIIGGLMLGATQDIEPSKEPTYKKTESIPRTYIKESLSELHNAWEPYTKARKASEWEYYEGKWVKWHAYVKQVDTAWHVSYQLLGTIEPNGMIGSDVGVGFTDSNLNTLVNNYNKGDVIYFYGKLKDYRSPISSNIFYVTDAQIQTPPSIAENPNKGTAEKADYSNEGYITSCIANGIPATICRNSINGE